MSSFLKLEKAEESCEVTCTQTVQVTCREREGGATHIETTELWICIEYTGRGQVPILTQYNFYFCFFGCRQPPTAVCIWIFNVSDIDIRMRMAEMSIIASSAQFDCTDFGFLHSFPSVILSHARVLKMWVLLCTLCRSLWIICKLFSSKIPCRKYRTGIFSVLYSRQVLANVV